MLEYEFNFDRFDFELEVLNPTCELEGLSDFLLEPKFTDVGAVSLSIDY